MTKPPAKASQERLHGIQRAARQASLRLRLARGIQRLPISATSALALGAVVLAVRKVAPSSFSERWAWLCVGVIVFVWLADLARALFKSLPPMAGALALDRHHDLRGRISNAVEFSDLGSGESSAFIDAAILDACRRAGELSPRSAVRLRVPPEMWVMAVAALGVAGLSLLEVQVVQWHPAPASEALNEGFTLSADDLEVFRRALQELKGAEQTPEVRDAIERFNQLLTDIAERRLSRSEAFRRMQKIDNELLKGAQADRKALEEELEQTAAELQKSPLTKPAAEALARNQLPDAQKALKKVAAALRQPKGKRPKKAELERLRKALERAVKNRAKAIAQLEEQRAAMRQDLLTKRSALLNKPSQGQKPGERSREQSLLRKKKRQLERLSRQLDLKKRAARRLSRLDRELAKAAADLARDVGLSAEALERAAEDLNRLESERMSDRDKEALRQRLQELREMIRQQGKRGKALRKRMQRFVKRARGGKQGSGARSGKRGGRPGKPGGRPGKPGGRPGEGAGSGMAQRPGGQGTPRAVVPVEVPGGSPGGSQAGSQPGGAGQGSQPSEKWGSGAGGNPKGKHASDIKAGHVDVRAEAIDTAQGPSNAEVILGAAQRGFRGKSYQKVFKQYRMQVESNMEGETIPDGMRFYVRRYFQLIRPRD